MGTDEISGHADVFPNGGETQPGCQEALTNLLKNPLGLGESKFHKWKHQWGQHAALLDNQYFEYYLYY